MTITARQTKLVPRPPLALSKRARVDMTITETRELGATGAEIERAVDLAAAARRALRQASGAGVSIRAGSVNGEYFSIDTRRLWLVTPRSLRQQGSPQWQRFPLQ